MDVHTASYHFTQERRIASTYFGHI